MTEEQCAEAFSVLVGFLRDFNFQWVIQQVEADIRVGKIIDKRIREVTAPHGVESAGFEVIETSEPRRGRSGSIKQRVEYSDRERLRILIEAIEHAILHTAELQETTLKLFGNTQPSTRIAFAPDGSDELPFTVDQLDIDTRQQSRILLQQTLGQLKVQADAP